jgi:hypothetical protein
MSATTSYEHWFDRLAAPQTRRQLLRAALAGAAITLPFARPAPGHAASPSVNTAGTCIPPLFTDPHACRKGCLYTAHRQYLRRHDACATANVAAGVGGVLVGLLTNPVVFFPYAGAILAASHCSDQALLELKAMQLDCLQPDCPGFDPCGPGGPCEYCNVVGVHCCPDQSVAIGYSCCAQCCKPTGSGCGSGVTECGG